MTIILRWAARAEPGSPAGPMRPSSISSRSDSGFPPANVDSGTRWAARNTPQGESFAVLAQGLLLLVHSGGVYLHLAWRGRLAALWPSSPSPPWGGDITNPWLSSSGCWTSSTPSRRTSASSSSSMLNLATGDPPSWWRPCYSCCPLGRMAASSSRRSTPLSCPARSGARWWWVGSP